MYKKRMKVALFSGLALLSFTAWAYNINNNAAPSLLSANTQTINNTLSHVNIEQVAAIKEAQINNNTSQPNKTQQQEINAISNEASALRVHYGTPLSPSTPAIEYNKTELLNLIDVHKETKVLSKMAPDLSPKVIKLALTAYNNAQKHGYFDTKQILTVVDYQIYDAYKRLWVFDLANNKVIFHTLVAQGEGSGWKRAIRFSNQFGSHASSIGTYYTGKSFVGNLGYSMHLIGLTPGFNDNAYAREIDMHSAWYVSEKLDHIYHHIGCSWGCLTLTKPMVRKVIDTIRNGTILFAYAPEKSWLHSPNSLVHSM